MEIFPLISFFYRSNLDIVSLHTAGNTHIRSFQPENKVKKGNSIIYRGIVERFSGYNTSDRIFHIHCLLIHFLYKDFVGGASSFNRNSDAC